MSPLQRKRIASIIVEAQAARTRQSATAADREVCKRHGVTLRTLQRWRIRLETDADLSQAVAALQSKVEEGWASGLADALRKQIAFLATAAEKANPEDPQAITAVSEAMTACSEVAATWKMLDARLTRPPGTPAKEAGSAAAGGGAGGAPGGSRGTSAPN